ncbi:unnamed protein product [Urochloa humidicola]
MPAAPPSASGNGKQHRRPWPSRVGVTGPRSALQARRQDPDRAVLPMRLSFASFPVPTCSSTDGLYPTRSQLRERGLPRPDSRNHLLLPPRSRSYGARTAPAATRVVA